MARLCTVCRHRDAYEINKLLLAGESYRVISRKYAVSEDSLGRHKASHIPMELIKSNGVQEVLSADSLTRQISDIRATIQTLLQQAIDSDNLRDAHNFAGDILKQIELEGKILGRIQEHSINVNLQPIQVNIYDAPEWNAVGDVLARVLGPHPELRLEVSRELIALQEAHT